MYDKLELGETYVVKADLPIFKLLALGDSHVYGASAAQKEAKRKEANKSQKENKEKKKEAAPKKEAPKDPDQEMVKNPNPEGRDKEVTKEAADRWNRENGKGGSEEKKPDEKPEEPKKDDKSEEDKHAEQIKEAGEASQNILKDLAPGKVQTPEKMDDDLDFLKPDPDDKNEKPTDEDELSEDDKLADEQGVERPSFKPDAKLTREQRKEMKEAQEQHKKDNPDDYEDEDEPKKEAPKEEPKPEETKEAKPADESVKPEEPVKPEPKPEEPKKEEKKPEPKKGQTPEQRKKQIEDLVSSPAYEMLRDEDQEALDTFLKDPKLQEHPEAIAGVEKLLKKYAKTQLKDKKQDYSIRDLTNVDEQKSTWSLEEMLDSFKSELGI